MNRAQRRAAKMRGTEITGIGCIITSRQQMITVSDLGQDVPALMVIDDYSASTGPALWRGAPAFAEWARFAIIQSTPQAFEAESEAVECWERVVLVKTSAKFVDEWAERFKGKHVLTVLADRFTEWNPRAALLVWETMQ